MNDSIYPQASKSYKLIQAKRRAYRLAERLARLLRMMPVCGMKGVVQRWNEYLPYCAYGIDQDSEIWFWQMAGNRMLYACEALLDDPKWRYFLMQSTETMFDMSESREICRRSWPGPFVATAFGLALLADPENRNLLVDAPGQAA